MNKELVKLAAAQIVKNELSKTSGIFDWFTNDPIDYYGPGYLDANVGSMENLGLFSDEYDAAIEEKIISEMARKEDERPRRFEERVFGEDYDYTVGSGHGYRTRPLVGYAWDEETQSMMPQYGSEYHKGQDYEEPRGTPVLAPFAGEVTSSHYGTGGGNMSYMTPYYPDESLSNLSFAAMHLDEPTGHSAGDILEAGDPWGVVGSTGRSKGPHLHASARINENESVHPAYMARRLERLFDKYEETERFSPFTENDFESDDDRLYLP